MSLVASLASKHAEKLQKHENQLRAMLQERQKVFEEAFREQMMKYITTGQVDYGEIFPFFYFVIIPFKSNPKFHCVVSLCY